MQSEAGSKEEYRDGLKKGSWNLSQGFREGGRRQRWRAPAPAFLFPERAWARRETLKIIQWSHFIPACDKEWLDTVLAKEWGQKHDANGEDARIVGPPCRVDEKEPTAQRDRQDL